MWHLENVWWEEASSTQNSQLRAPEGTSVAREWMWTCSKVWSKQLETLVQSKPCKTCIVNFNSRLCSLWSSDGLKRWRKAKNWDLHWVTFCSKSLAVEEEAISNATQSMTLIQFIMDNVSSLCHIWYFTFMFKILIPIISMTHSCHADTSSCKSVSSRELARRTSSSEDSNCACLVAKNF